MKIKKTWERNLGCLLWWIRFLYIYVTVFPCAVPSQGHVTSYYGLGMQKYTSFQVHAQDEVRQLLSIDNYLLSLTSDSLRCSSKFGLTQFTYM